MSQLSVTIITRDEGANIRRCLESIRWADEIIVVDSGSTDNTVAIAKEYTQNVYLTDWPGYGKQKNRAVDYATKPWVLSLDADEEISPELQQQIRAIVQQPPVAAAYKLPSQLVFLGRLIRHANGKSEHIRLFQRTQARFQDVDVHEGLEVNGKVISLTAPLYHYSFGEISRLVNKMNFYTSLVAKQRLERGRRATMGKAFFHALWMFIRVYFLKRGFLDGGPGLILAFSFAEGAFYRYAKMCYPERVS